MSLFVKLKANFRRSWIPLCAALVVGSAPNRALAHDHWMELEPFFSSVPGKAKVYLYVGEHFAESELVPVRRRDRYARFQVMSAAGLRDVISNVREDAQPFALLNAGERTLGTFVLGLDAAPRAIEVPAQKFQEYLLEERLIDALMWRAGRGQEDALGRERYSRHLKAILQIGPKLDDVAMRQIGQELEIVPLLHPYSIVPGGTLPIMVLFQGKPLPGRAVMAANRYRSQVVTTTIRTDVRGIASFPLPRTGDWMIRLVHIEPATGDVDFRSYWASLTFSLPER